jgi:hypothetical protein
MYHDYAKGLAPARDQSFQSLSSDSTMRRHYLMTYRGDRVLMVLVGASECAAMQAELPRRIDFRGRGYVQSRISPRTYGSQHQAIVRVACTVIGRSIPLF